MNEDVGKKIAIVTGASGGIGRTFVDELMKEELDEIWVIGRNKERLNAILQQYGQKIVCICMDLTNSQDLLSLKDQLNQRKVWVAYLLIMQELQMKPSLHF